MIALGEWRTDAAAHPLSHDLHTPKPASDTTGAYTAKAVSATIKEAKAAAPRPPVKALSRGTAARRAAPVLSRACTDGEARDLHARQHGRLASPMARGHRAPSRRH
eukprot:tig00020689_g13007.t1